MKKIHPVLEKGKFRQFPLNMNISKPCFQLYNESQRLV